MKRAKSLVALALVGHFALGCGSRTELMFGVATDLRAPDAIDTVQLDVVRTDNGVSQTQVVWDISGAVNVPFNLPGSYGVFSEGDEFQLGVTLTGLKNGTPLVTRKSIVGLVEGETLFYRIGLTAGCIARTDCPEGFSCVEGVCRDENINSAQLPDFTASLVNELSCAAGANYLDTGTGDPMPLSATASECPAGLCLEGTCLKPPPPESGTRTVRGSQIKTFALPNDETTPVPVDLSTFDVAAILTDEDGTTTTLPGVGNADGTFAIQNVPHGKYVLKVGTEYTVTTGDNVDLGFVTLGRTDKAPVTDTTNTGLTFNVTGMSPWEPGNVLSAYSPTADQWWFFFDQGVETPPTNGDIALTNFAINYDNPGTAGANLIDGDAFALLQYTNRPAGDPDGTQYQAVTKILQPSAFTMVDGQSTPINGAFTNVTLDQTVSFDVRQLDWESMVGWNGTNPQLLNPTATAVDTTIAGSGELGVSIDLLGQPGGSQFGSFSATVDYLFVTAQRGKNSMFSNLMYSTPNIGGYTYGKQLFAGLTYAVPYQFGTANPVNHIIRVDTIRPADSDLMIVTPLLGPVRDATINDRDIFVPQNDVPPTSRISWKAPALGTASLYSVDFFQLGVNANNKTTKTKVASVTTTDTFLDVPPGILATGQSYFVVIGSTTNGNIDAPNRFRLPDSRTPVASAQFTVGAGATDPGGADAGPIGPPDVFIAVDTPAGSVCDPIAQDCGGGNKCTFDGNEFRFLCAPNGTIANNASTCTGTGNGDNCVAGTLCIVGTCRSYCPQNGNTVGCQVNETCQTAGPFNICLTNCNALAQNCPATGAGPQNCYENQAGGECLKSNGNLAIGQSCFELHDCVGGSGCHGGTCRKYCNHDTFPEMQGPCSAGQVCTSLAPNNPVGICQ